jgi:hypothetical protein
MDDIGHALESQQSGVYFHSAGHEVNNPQQQTLDGTIQ